MNSLLKNVPRLECCLCKYKAKSEDDLELHIDQRHSDIFKSQSTSTKQKEKIVKPSNSQKLPKTAPLQIKVELGELDYPPQKKMKMNPEIETVDLEDFDNNREIMKGVTIAFQKDDEKEKKRLAKNEKQRKRRADQRLMKEADAGSNQLFCQICLKPYVRRLYLANHIIQVHNKVSSVCQESPTVIAKNLQLLKTKVDDLEAKREEDLKIAKEKDENTVAVYEEVNSIMRQAIDKETLMKIEHQNAASNFNQGAVLLEAATEELNLARKEIVLCKDEAAKFVLAEVQIDLAMKFDYDHRFWLKLTGFLSKSSEITPAPKNLAELNILKVTQILNEIVEGTFFLVRKAQFYKRNEKRMDVSFSEDTDVEKILKILEEHCRKEPQKIVTRFVMNTTTVRLSILQSICDKVLKTKELPISSCKVLCVGSLPTLSVVYKNETVDTELNLTYVKAIAQFEKYMEPEDFRKAFDLCKKINIPKAIMPSFAITFPK